MEITWLAPSAVLAIGSAAVVAMARRIGASVDELDRARRRAVRLEDSLIPVRVEARRARSAVDRLRQR